MMTKEKVMMMMMWFVNYNNDDVDEQVGGGGSVDWPAGVTEGNAGGTPSGIIDLIKETVSQVCYGNPLFSRQMNSTAYRLQPRDTAFQSFKLL